MATDLTMFGMHLLQTDRVSGWVKMPGRCFRLWGSTFGGSATHWAGVETARGVYSWTALDAVMAKVSGKIVFHTFGYVPTWANGGTGSVSARGTVPTNFQDAADYITALVTRYAGQIACYSPINEPGPTWWTVDATNVALSAISKAWCVQHFNTVKSIDPNALVSSPEFQAVNPLLQADDFYATGYGVYCDVHAIHAYPLASVYRYRPEQMLDIDSINRRILAYYNRPNTMYWSEGSGSNQVTDPAQLLAFASIYPLIAASDGIAMFNWYAYDGVVWGQLGDAGAGFSATAVAYRETIKWITGATWTNPIARVPGTNLLRNPLTTLNGTTNWPTNWGAFNPDSAKGVSVAVKNTGTENGVPYIDVRVFGTAAANATGYVQVNMDTATGIPCSVGQLWTDTANVSVPTGRNGLLYVGVGHSYFDSSGTYYSFGYNTQAPVFQTLSVGSPISISQMTVDAGAAFIQPYVKLFYAPGSTFDFTARISQPVVDTGTWYTGAFTKSNGYQAMVAWNGVPASFNNWPVPAGYTLMRDCYGKQSAVTPGNTITLTQQPILIENQAVSLWLH